MDERVGRILTTYEVDRMLQGEHYDKAKLVTDRAGAESLLSELYGKAAFRDGCHRALLETEKFFGQKDIGKEFGEDVLNETGLPGIKHVDAKTGNIFYIHGFVHGTLSRDLDTALGLNAYKKGLCEWGRARHDKGEMIFFEEGVYEDILFHEVTALKSAHEFGEMRAIEKLYGIDILRDKIAPTAIRNGGALLMNWVKKSLGLPGENGSLVAQSLQDLTLKAQAGDLSSLLAVRKIYRRVPEPFLSLIHDGEIQVFTPERSIYLFWALRERLRVTGAKGGTFHILTGLLHERHLLALLKMMDEGYDLPEGRNFLSKKDLETTKNAMFKFMAEKGI